MLGRDFVVTSIEKYAIHDSIKIKIEQNDLKKLTVEPKPYDIDNPPQTGVTSVNGKVGDVVISISDVSGLQTALNDKVDNSRVLTDVPLNAKFTDTVYTHPSTHSASMITESTTKRFVNDTEKATWNAKWDYDETTIKAVKVTSASNADTVNNLTVKTAVPTGAKFTDTVTTVNGKTGAIVKADIVALGIPTQDTVYIHPSTHSADMIVDGTTNKAYTNIEKTKLAGIASGAEVNVQSDWNATSGDAYIKNKPTTIAGYGITDSYTKSEIDNKVSSVYKYRGSVDTYASLPSTGLVVGDVYNVTDTDINYAWDGIAWDDLGGVEAVATATNNGLMTKEDKTKLDNVEQGANKYTHPSNHPYSILTGVPTKLSDFSKDINFDERYYTENETDTLLGDKTDKTYVNSELDKKQNSLGYTPVNKSGDAMTGQLGVESTTFPVINIARNTSGTGIGLYGGARLQRKTTNPTNGVGIGFYFQAPNSNKAMTHAGMFGGALGTIQAGSEKGEIVISPSYAGQDPYLRRDLIVRATSKSKAEAELNGKLKTDQTLASDSNDTVTTKKYVDDGLDSKVNNSRVLTDVPSNAKFTDTNTTYSEITTAEIDLGTASTLRVITARRVQYILDKVGSMISTAIGALTKSSVGLDNVDNTSDINKPISTNTQTALNLKANLSSPSFTGTPTAPTATSGANTTQIATTAFVQNALSSGGYGDMLKSIYDSDNDGIVDKAEVADSVAWTGITGKPSTFTPSTHTHAKSQITDFPTSLPANGGNADTAISIDGGTY